MKKNTFVLFLCVTALFAPCLVQAQEAGIFKQEGIASWYGKEFDGRPTASGEIFDSSQLTAAHPNLPFGTMLVVTNRHNNKKVTVRVNDRGPFVAARIVDISRAAAEQLDMIVTGTAPVLIESVGGVAVSRPVTPAPQVQPVYAPVTETVKVAPTLSQPQPVVAPVQPPPAQPVYAPVAVEPVQPPPAPQSQPVYTPAPITVFVPPAVDTQAITPPVTIAISSVTHARLTPDVDPISNKIYRLQVGSYKVARNAVDAYEKLRDAGLSPAYEQNDDYFRVVLAGINGNDVYSVTEKIASAGFIEALIREER